MVVQAKRQQKVQNENEPNNCQVKNISIDPKTWVKLGHFHLLLEEYRKGNKRNLLENKLVLMFIIFSFIGISDVLQNSSRKSLARYNISLWLRTGVFSFQCFSVVSTFLHIFVEEMKSVVTVVNFTSAIPDVGTNIVCEKCTMNL